MNGFLNDYCRSLGLNSEEAKVISAISQGSANTADLERKLGIDSAKLHSSLASLFLKASVSSIGEIFAQLLSFSASRQQTCMGFHRRPSVMVVDDEPEICEIIKADLEERGARCHTYVDPRAALREFQYLKVDAIVTDFRMPEMNGLEMIQKMRLTVGVLPPVVLVSADFSKKDLFDLYDLGAYAFLQKPVDEGVLFKTILESYYDPPRTHEMFARPSNVLALRLPQGDHPDRPRIGRGGLQLSPNYLQGQLGLASPFLPEGTTLELSVELPRAQGPFRSFAEVAWRNSVFGLGIRFTQTSEYDLNLLHEYVARNQISSFIPKPPEVASA